MLLSSQPQHLVLSILDDYDPPANFDNSFLARMVGIAIMRRLIGIAQLPVTFSLDEKATLLNKAAKMIKSGELSL